MMNYEKTRLCPVRRKLCLRRVKSKSLDLQINILQAWTLAANSTKRDVSPSKAMRFSPLDV